MPKNRSKKNRPSTCSRKTITASMRSSRMVKSMESHTTMSTMRRPQPIAQAMLSSTRGTWSSCKQRCQPTRRHQTRTTSRSTARRLKCPMTRVSISWRPWVSAMKALATSASSPWTTSLLRYSSFSTLMALGRSQHQTSVRCQN